MLGGLVAGGASASGVYALRTTTGAARQIGALAAPLHDAAVSVSGGRVLVLGGGSPATVATVQSFALAAPGRRSRGAVATRTRSLPAPRSDAVAVTIGATTYLVGGYDGARPDASVLATTTAGRSRRSPRCRYPCATRRSPLWGGRSSSSAGRPSPARRRRAGGRHPGRRPCPPLGGGHRPSPGTPGRRRSRDRGRRTVRGRRREPGGPAADPRSGHDPAWPCRDGRGGRGRGVRVAHLDRLGHLGV